MSATAAIKDQKKIGSDINQPLTISLSKTLNVLTSISADEKFTSVSAYLLPSPAGESPSNVFMASNAELKKLDHLYPKLTISVDSKTGHLYATLERFNPDVFPKDESALAVIVKDQFDEYHLAARPHNKKSHYPIVHLSFKDTEGGQGWDGFQLIWFHGGLYDQLNIVKSKPPIPLVVYNPPRLIDCGFSTTWHVETATAGESKFYMLLKRRSRPASQHKNQSEYQIEYYKKRDIDMPVGSEYYSVTKSPCDNTEWDIDTFLIAECSGVDCLKEFVNLFIQKPERDVHFTHGIAHSSAAGDD